MHGEESSVLFVPNQARMSLRGGAQSAKRTSGCQMSMAMSALRAHWLSNLQNQSARPANVHNALPKGTWTHGAQDAILRVKAQ